MGVRKMQTQWLSHRRWALMLGRKSDQNEDRCNNRCRNGDSVSPVFASPTIGFNQNSLDNTRDDGAHNGCQQDANKRLTVRPEPNSPLIRSHEVPSSIKLSSGALQAGAGPVKARRLERRYTRATHAHWHRQQAAQRPSLRTTRLGFPSVTRSKAAQKANDVRDPLLAITIVGAAVGDNANPSHPRDGDYPTLGVSPQMARVDATDGNPRHHAGSGRTFLLLPDTTAREPVASRFHSHSVRRNASFVRVRIVKSRLPEGCRRMFALANSRCLRRCGPRRTSDFWLLNQIPPSVPLMGKSFFHPVGGGAVAILRRRTVGWFGWRARCPARAPSVNRDGSLLALDRRAGPADVMAHRCVVVPTTFAPVPIRLAARGRDISRFPFEIGGANLAWEVSVFRITSMDEKNNTLHLVRKRLVLLQILWECPQQDTVGQWRISRLWHRPQDRRREAINQLARFDTANPHIAALFSFGRLIPTVPVAT